MPRKPAHQSLDTLKLIQDVSFYLFGRHGYDGVSIGAIAEAAKLSKGALYWHYPGKEALYLDCLKRLHALFDDHVFSPVRREDDPVLGITAMFAGLEQLLGDPRIQSGVAGFWLATSGPGLEAFETAQRRFEQESTEVIDRCLRRGVERGQFDFGDDLDNMVHTIITLAEAAVLPLRHRTPAEFRAVTRMLARSLFRAHAPGVRLPALLN